MDILIKNNIIKRTKAIIDIGAYETKILEVYYAAKKAEVQKASSFENAGMITGGSIDFKGIAMRADAELHGKSRRDVSVSLPAELAETKIITIKNKSGKEIDKIIRRDYFSFGGVSMITHVIDYAFLGKREEQGDTIFYYLLSAVQKSIMNEMITAFEEYKLQIKTVVSSIYNQICLSELFYDEYTHLNRLFIDFGTRTTRITAFAEGIAVYSRQINYGFASYADKLFEAQNRAGKQDIAQALLYIGSKPYDDCDLPGTRIKELIGSGVYTRCINETDNAVLSEIMRVIDLCANNDAAPTKIYCTGRAVAGFTDKLQTHTGLDCEHLIFEACDEKSGRDYALCTDEIKSDERYSNAYGLAVYPFL